MTDPASALAVNQSSQGTGSTMGPWMLGSTALNIAGNEWLRGRANDDARKAAQKAWQRSKSAMKHKYRWAMEDMQKAGLNPILAAGSSGFSIGSSAQAQQAQLAQPNYIDVGSTARDVMSSFQSEAETAKAEQETELIYNQSRTEIERAKETIQRILESKSKVKLQDAQAVKAFTEEKKIFREVELAQKKIDIANEQIQVLKRQQAELESRTDYQQQQSEESKRRQEEIDQKTALIRTQVKELKLKLYELTRNAEVFKGPAGIWIKSIERIMDAFNVHLIR